jgi:hypothetical protein
MGELHIEGQIHVVPDDILAHGATVPEQDQFLREALRSQFDLAANASFRREQREGKLVVSVVKTPGTKGGESMYERLLRALRAAPNEISTPMRIALNLHLLEARGQLDADALVDWQPRLERALEVGRQEQKEMAKALLVLRRASPAPARAIPDGF